MTGLSSDRAQRDRASVTAVIVYFRTPRLLAESLDGLRSQGPTVASTIVVDNSSAIDGLHERPAAGDDYTWSRAGGNIGYAAACNLGARGSSGDYLLFLNADLVLDARACERLLDFAESDPRLAVVGPRIIAKDGTIELSAREFPTAGTSVLGRSSVTTKLLARVGVTPRALGHAEAASSRVDWVSGACMLVRRRAFEQVGGFDEGYWMYWEDADLCRRLRDEGWGTALCVEAIARHQTGSSGTSERTIRAFHASASRYYERHVARSRRSARAAHRLLLLRMRVILAVRARRSA